MGQQDRWIEGVHRAQEDVRRPEQGTGVHHERSAVPEQQRFGVELVRPVSGGEGVDQDVPGAHGHVPELEGPGTLHDGPARRAALAHPAGEQAHEDPSGPVTRGGVNAAAHGEIVRGGSETGRGGGKTRLHPAEVAIGARGKPHTGLEARTESTDTAVADLTADIGHTECSVHEKSLGLLNP
ncbi:hypothetical protein GCM10010264_68150 [Streptomyces globisporus]|nr:hypothetical protein GCM10010264_68150 [Streptomyces globisporus]